MKLIQFSRPLTPPVHLYPKFSHPLDVGRPISNDSPSPNVNQSTERKHNPRMTIICFQVLPSGQLYFSVSAH